MNLSIYLVIVLSGWVQREGWGGEKTPGGWGRGGTPCTHAWESEKEKEKGSYMMG